MPKNRIAQKLITLSGDEIAAYLSKLIIIIVSEDIDVRQYSKKKLILPERNKSIEFALKKIKNKNYI